MKRARTTEAKDERRNALLAAALDTFFDHGFAAARMDEIAARAGVSKGALYLYFDSKEALFKALITSLAMPNLDRIEAIAAAASSVAEALNGLAAYAPTMIRHSNIPRLMKVMIGDSHLFPEIVADYRTRILDRVLGALTLMLDRAKQRGEIATENPALTARLVIAPILFSGIWQAMFSATPGAEVDLKSLFAMHADFMIRALSPTGAEQ